MQPVSETAFEHLPVVTGPKILGVVAQGDHGTVYLARRSDDRA